MHGPIFAARARGIDAASVFRTLGVAGLTLLATVLAGALAGWWVGPQFGVKALLGLPIIAIAILVCARPIVGVYLLALLIPIENVIVIGDPSTPWVNISGPLPGIGAVTLVRLIAPLVLVVWGLQKLASRSSWERITSANILIPSLLFLAWASASLLWSENMFAGIGELLTTAMLLVFSVLVLDTVDSWQRLERIVKLLMLGGLIAVSLTMAQGLLFPGITRLGDGVSGGVNQTAWVMVVLVPLSFFLLRGGGSWLWRILGLAYMTLAPIGVIGTFSRAAFVVMPVVFGIQLWGMSKDGFRGITLILLTLSVIGVISVTTVSWEGVMDRGNTIGPAIEGGGEISTSRMHHWLGAILIFQDHPLLGVGYGNFGHEFRTYQYLVPEKYVHYYFNSIRSPHSTFLGILSELGLVGAALWVWLLAIALLNVRKSWHKNKEADNRPQYILAQAVFYSLMAYGIFSLVNVVHLDKLLWLLLGLTVALRNLTTSQGEP